MKKDTKITPEDFSVMEKTTHEHVSEHMRELMSYCEKDESIAEFVRLLTYPMLHPDMQYKNSRSMDYRVGDCLSSLLYDLTQFDFRSATTNEYHFQTNWISEINSFIGNFFQDDAYFTVKQTGNFKTWEASSHDGEGAVQDPQVLIEAARDIAKFYLVEDDFELKKITPEEWRKTLLHGMISSGQVEALMAPYMENSPGM